MIALSADRPATRLSTRLAFLATGFALSCWAPLVPFAKARLGVDEGQVDNKASFVDDLGADSLDIVELVMAFEEAFELEIPDEDAEKIATVGDAVTYIEGKAKK